VLAIGIKDVGEHLKVLKDKKAERPQTSKEYSDSSISEAGGLGMHRISANLLVKVAAFLCRSMVCV